jgi:hypothetical protein
VGVGKRRDPHRTEDVSPWWPPIRDRQGEPWVPNLSDWQAGDILLFSKTAAKDPIGTYIEARQKALTALGPTHTKWIHAAVYVRDGVCVEATYQSGVSVTLDALGKRLEHSDISVVRLRRTAEGADVTPDIGWQIAEVALSYLSLQYPSFVALRSAMARDVVDHARAMAALRQGAKQTVYCSLLCHAAIAVGTGVDLAATMNLHPLPCTFSASPLFETMPVIWCKANE